MSPAITFERLRPRAAERIFQRCRAPPFSAVRFARSVGPRFILVNGPHIAIVDDDESLCTSMVDFMRSLGCRAEAFTSAEAFFASPHFLSFDCVIADVHMPGMSGLELVRNFRKLGGTAPVIIITALPDRDLDERAVAAGAQCLLRKPFADGALLNCIEGLFSNDRPRR